MKNYEKSLETIDYANGVTARSSGAFVLISGVVGCCVNDIAASTTGPVIVQGRFVDCAKTTGEAWAQGEVVYWKDSTSKFTTTASGNTLAGRASAAALSAATTGSVALGLN
tara:strand:- start:14 stop:346 length:333 start_codon:yes stop_codon:yes gene_type:complete